MAQIAIPILLLGTAYLISNEKQEGYSNLGDDFKILNNNNNNFDNDICYNDKMDERKILRENMIIILIQILVKQLIILIMKVICHNIKINIF